MGRGTRDDPLTDEELEAWWIMVRQKHAAANAAWQAEVERKLNENENTKASYKGSYDRAAEEKTGQNKDKKSSKPGKPGNTGGDKVAYKPVKISKGKIRIPKGKSKTSRSKKSAGKKNQTGDMF
jgi:hypothetical protein